VTADACTCHDDDDDDSVVAYNDKENDVNCDDVVNLLIGHPREKFIQQYWRKDYQDSLDASIAV